MRISVLTVCWNSAATIRNTLDSFFAQEHDDKEIVVVDGASTDETLSIVRSYPQEKMILLSEPDKGMYDALNKALRLYTGDAMGVLNSDDAFHDATVLGRISMALKSADIACGSLNFVKDHDGKQVVRKWPVRSRPAGGFRSGWMPAHPTFYVRRGVADRVGEFDLTFRVASDYDWMLRATDLFAHKSVAIDHVLVDMMIGGASTHGMLSYLAHNLEALRSRRRWLGSGYVDYALIAKPMRKVGQFFS